MAPRNFFRLIWTRLNSARPSLGLAARMWIARNLNRMRTGHAVLSTGMVGLLSPLLARPRFRHCYASRLLIFCLPAFDTMDCPSAGVTMNQLKADREGGRMT